MPLTFVLTFFLVAGWIILETYCYVLIGRSLRRYVKSIGYMVVFVPVGLLGTYFIIIFLIALFH